MTNVTQIKQEILRTDDGRVASTITLNNERSTTRYYDSAGIMAAAIMSLRNILSHARESSVVELQTNVFSLKTCLSDETSYTSKHRDSLLELISERNITLIFK